MKSTKFYVAISLLVEAFTSMIMFFVLLTKKKSLAGAFFAMSVVSAAVGGYLAYECKQAGEFDDLCECCGDDCGCGCDCDEGECECGSNDDIDIDEGDLFAREDENK